MIFSTDEEKSLLFFLSTLMKFRMIIVMIVSLIAVMQDLKNRCIDAEINCVIWDLNDRSHYNNDLLFVTMKHAIESTFLNHLHVMYDTEILKRIVMNEVHVILTHRNFKSRMNRLMMMMRILSIQIVLMIATLSLIMEKDLQIVLISISLRKRVVFWRSIRDLRFQIRQF